MDSAALAGMVILLGDNIKGYLDRIRDHVDEPASVEAWADKADEQLQTLCHAARQALGDDDAKGT